MPKPDDLLLRHEAELALRRAVIGAATPELRTLNGILQAQREQGHYFSQGHDCEQVIRILRTPNDTMFMVDPAYAQKYGLKPAALQAEVGDALTQLNVPVRVTPTGLAMQERSFLQKLKRQPVQEQLFFRMAADAAVDAAHQSGLPAMRRERESILARRAVEQRLEEAGHSRGSIRFALNAYGHPHIDGTYVPTELLAQPRVGSMAANLSGYHQHMPEVADYLKREGIGRVSYLASGASSVAFETVPDAKGRQQLILLTPPNQEYIPHPAILPDRACHIIRDANGTPVMQVRVSPALLRGEDYLTGEDVKRMHAMFEASGLRSVDLVTEKGLHVKNLLVYVDENGQRLHYCNDRDAVQWPKGISEDGKQALMRQWDETEAFAAYRKATPALMADGHIQNTFSESYTARLARQAIPEAEAAPARSSLASMARKNGMYPADFTAASEQALQLAEKEAGDIGHGWRRHLARAVEEFHPSVKPGTITKMLRGLHR